MRTGRGEEAGHDTGSRRAHRTSAVCVQGGKEVKAERDEGERADEHWRAHAKRGGEGRREEAKEARGRNA